MNLNDYESAWKRQPNQIDAEKALSTLMRTFETESRKQQRGLFWRDICEASAGLFLVGYFTHIAWQGGKGYWPIAISIMMILSVTVFFILERIRTRKARVSPHAPLLAKLEADLAELQHQHRLLLNVVRWYIAPLMLAWAIIVATKVANHPNNFQETSEKVKLAAYIILCAILAIVIRMYNRWTARRKIEPRIKELERMRSEFGSEGTKDIIS